MESDACDARDLNGEALGTKGEMVFSKLEMPLPDKGGMMVFPLLRKTLTPSASGLKLAAIIWRSRLYQPLA